MMSYRSATDEVERVLAIQKNYYAVLKVPPTSTHMPRLPGPASVGICICPWEPYGLWPTSSRWASTVLIVARHMCALSVQLLL